MAEPNIPLHCNICPKKPNFSDVSHLLTHVASKGHLSHYYRLKVRAGKEPTARRIVETYDRWYIEWKVEALMSDRLNLKDKKRGRPRTNCPSRAASILTTPRPRTARRATLRDEQQQQAPNSAPPTFPAYAGNSLAKSYVDPTTLQQGQGPYLPDWSYRSDAPHLKEEGGSVTPRMPSNDPSVDFAMPQWMEELFPAGTEDHPDEMMVADSNKLKGILWPGMDIFDSATVEMKRKRNQKKDVSVLEQLEQSSQGVDGIECVYTPKGTFKKQRRISLLLNEESSPLMTDIPSPPRRKRARRPALAAIDPNLRRPSTRLKQYADILGSSQAVYDDDDIEDELFSQYHDQNPTTAASQQSRKRPFEVYQDPTTIHVEQSHQHPQNAIHYTHVPSMNVLNGGFHVPPTPYYKHDVSLSARQASAMHPIDYSMSHGPYNVDTMPQQTLYHDPFSSYGYGPLPSLTLPSNAAGPYQHPQPSSLGHEMHTPNVYHHPFFMNATGFHQNSMFDDEDVDDDGATISASPSVRGHSPEL